jgi:preprotein translocase subunit SecA
VLQKADALALRGEDERAFELLDQALEAKDRWRFFMVDAQGPGQLAAQFALLYNELRCRLRRVDWASLHGSFLGAGRKVGRNDPCPCGSGKKYKKCCLTAQ